VWNNGLLWYRDHLYLCKNSQLKQKVLLELNASPIGGHSGFLKNYHMIKKDIFWEGLKNDVQKFVDECVVYQQNKGETIKSSCLLQLLAIVDTERGVNQYQVQFKTFFNLYLNHSIISNEQ
jgi:hypothetical protein